MYWKNNETIDKIIVWLVGFSVTIIVALLLKVPANNPIIEKSGSLIMFFACLTILFGITQRIAMVVINKREIDFIIDFNHFVTGYNLPENTKYTRVLSVNENSLSDIIDYLKNDFGFVYSGHIPKPGNKEYLELQNELILKYDELQDNLLVFEVNLANKTLSKKIGREIPEITTTEDINAPKSNDIGIWTLLKISNWLFYLMSISFVSTILTAVFTYLIVIARNELI